MTRHKHATSMILRVLTRIIVASLSAVPVLGAQQAGLTIERIVSQPAIAGTAPTRPTWSPDSRWLGFLWNDRAQPQRALWIVGRDGTRLRALASAAPGSAVTEFAWLPDGRALIYLAAGDLWRVPFEGDNPERLTSDGGKADLAVSPDGRLISFRQAGDLWLHSLVDHRTTQATRVGQAPRGSQPLGTYYRWDPLESTCRHASLSIL